MKNPVLIIDHDLATCKDIKYSLVSDTTEAYYCLTLLDGLAALGKKDYELVILNISFPESDGMELLETMRQLKPMPILLLSTSVSLDDGKRKVVQENACLRILRMGTEKTRRTRKSGWWTVKRPRWYGKFSSSALPDLGRCR